MCATVAFLVVWNTTKQQEGHFRLTRLLLFSDMRGIQTIGRHVETVRMLYVSKIT